MNIAKAKQLIKNKILGKEKTWCIAVSNYASEENWSLFFDVDHDDHYALTTMVDTVQKILKVEPIIIHTKHGIQLMTFPFFTLKQVYFAFQQLKAKVKTDYFWSIPLWLRISPKYNEKGEIISPKPEPYSAHYQQYEYLVKYLPHRKLYQTWD